MRAENKTMAKTKKKVDKLLAVQKPKYENTLYSVVDIVPEDVRKNTEWEYGYNKEYDFVCISKDGTLGEIYKVQGLLIGLPEEPEEVYARSEDPKEQYWEREQYPSDAQAKKIKNTSQLQYLKEEDRSKWEDFIIRHWESRDNGYWFKVNGKSTYITGAHFFYVQWAMIDIGFPGYRDANRIFWYFREATVADNRCFGMCYLKNRRSGFSYMAASELVNQATKTANSNFGILSMTGDDAKKLFTGKVVPIANRLPFFFQPIRAGESVPKSELLYQVPSTKLTKKKLEELLFDEEEDQMIGLDSKIDWKTTQENSYDGQKLHTLVHDESGKWPTGNDIRNNWNIARTCLRLGSKISGKCMMGSTCNKQSDGGAEFKELYYDSDLRNGGRNANGQTPTGMYSLFIPMEWNYEGAFDKYGYPIFDTPEEPILNEHGDYRDIGVIEEWENEINGLKHAPARMNEHYRQFPRTESHAFRDEISGSMFNLAKIQDQIDHNDALRIEQTEVLRGNFYWRDGIQDSEVLFREDPAGRFKVNWLPPPDLRNNVEVRNGLYHPGNPEFGAFGCDSYDVSGTVYGSGSNGALSGLTGASMHPKVPDHRFFLEYVARPKTVEIFFEEVLMACVYYGMPILIENNKPRLLYHFRDRGYRKYSLKRPDKRTHKLSDDEKFLGGIPNSSQDIILTHAAGIESWVENHVGYDEHTGEIGYMPFSRTLEDWMWFDIKKRTVYDATIASGLAIMAVNRFGFNNEHVIERQTIPNPWGKYDNSGNYSTLKQ